MENINSAVATLIHGSNTLFILLGAIMVLAMHAGFAFLEVGTVRQKNQVNALSKILSDFAISALAYFFIGYWIAYGINFLEPAAVLTENIVMLQQDVPAMLARLFDLVDREETRPGVSEIPTRFAPV